MTQPSKYRHSQGRISVKLFVIFFNVQNIGRTPVNGGGSLQAGKIINYTNIILDVSIVGVAFHANAANRTRTSVSVASNSDR
jgi:hypothetical protein